jgi:hypothetical protein
MPATARPARGKGVRSTGAHSATHPCGAAGVSGSAVVWGGRNLYSEGVCRGGPDAALQTGDPGVNVRVGGVAAHGPPVPFLGLRSSGGCFPGPRERWGWRGETGFAANRLHAAAALRAGGRSWAEACLGERRGNAPPPPSGRVCGQRALLAQRIVIGRPGRRSRGPGAALAASGAWPRYARGAPISAGNGPWCWRTRWTPRR